MARRAIWKGVLSFGKIHIPVRLYAAVEDRAIAFHLLHDKDRVRLRQQMVCTKDNEPVPDGEIVKGLEVGDEKYVVVGEAELAALEPESDRTIEVGPFIAPDGVDPRYFDRPYHLGPDGDETGYAALASALEAENRLGVCRWAFRKRFYNGVLRGEGGVLQLVTLRAAAEVRDPGELHLPQESLAKKERAMARRLIDELSEPFDPSQYQDEFRALLADLVQTKAKGGNVKKRSVRKPEPTEADALMKMLQTSLEELEGAK